MTITMIAKLGLAIIGIDNETDLPSKYFVEILGF